MRLFFERERTKISPFKIATIHGNSPYSASLSLLPVILKPTPSLFLKPHCLIPGVGPGPGPGLMPPPLLPPPTGFPVSFGGAGVGF